MPTTVTLEWEFTPRDFFEEPETIERPNYALMIDDGKIKATFDAAVYDANPAIGEALGEELQARFLGANLINPKRFDLHGPYVTRLDPDGHRAVAITLGAAMVQAVGLVVDMVTFDKDGNVISDTKRDRIEKRKLFAARVAAHRDDPTLMALVKSRDAAVREPDIELVRFYEIGDCLQAYFGSSRKRACAELGIDRKRWGRLERLCNNQEVRQARHRGGSIGRYRDATQGELEEARAIAAEMIDRYLFYREAVVAVKKDSATG